MVLNTSKRDIFGSLNDDAYQRSNIELLKIKIEQLEDELEDVQKKVPVMLSDLPNDVGYVTQDDVEDILDDIEIIDAGTALDVINN